MILWTIQHENAYKELCDNGVLYAKESRILEDFEDAYHWLADQMKSRIGNPPKGVTVPIWAWYQWEGKRKRLDMRWHGRHFTEKGTPIVLMTIDVPDNAVLLSDFDYWHAVLNDGDLIFPYDDDIFYTEEERRKSWENIFDITCSFDDEEHDGLTTQATMWEIKKEWVIKVEHFITR